MPQNKVVEIDETYVGGKAANRKNHIPPKAAVLALVERDEMPRHFGDVRAEDRPEQVAREKPRVGNLDHGESLHRGILTDGPLRPVVRLEEASRKLAATRNDPAASAEHRTLH